MPEPKADSGSSRADSGPSRPKSRTRLRTILNLGQPFVQVDQLVNQAEEAVAIGYQVLEDVVKQIQAGYDEAKLFNIAQNAAKEKGEPPPPIPWEQLVERTEKLQDIALKATRQGTRIFLDTVDDSVRSANKLAKTLVRSRKDVDTKMERLAGPVFEDPIEVEAVPGKPVRPIEEPIAHRGLARLRIEAQVEYDSSSKDGASSGLLRERTPEDETSAATLKVKGVKFEPGKDPDVSVLTIDIGEIPAGQRLGVYEGRIRAKNFELLIANLRVTVAGATRSTTAQRPSGVAATPGQGAAGPGQDKASDSKRRATSKPSTPRPSSERAVKPTRRRAPSKNSRRPRR